MNSKRTLLNRLKNREYRAAFISSMINSTIAYQIRGLRKARELDQAEFGALVGMKQTAISRLENPDYGNLSVNTLKRIAKALDIGLVVRFAPYSEVVRWRLTMSQRDMVPSTFAQDVALYTGSTTAFGGVTVSAGHSQGGDRTSRGNHHLSSAGTVEQLSLQFEGEVVHTDNFGGSTAMARAA